MRAIDLYASGGPTDVVTRLLAELSDHAGKQFCVENMGGGGGDIAVRRPAEMARHGYTLLMVGPSCVINPRYNPKAPC